MSVTPNRHRIDITVSSGGYLTWKISCDAPRGAECRLWCNEGCEAHYGTETHDLTDQGYCVQTEGWFDDTADLYDGPDDEPLRSGPVEFTWTGDGYLWHYAPEPADADTALEGLEVPA